jgi:hypothetical protein
MGMLIENSATGHFGHWLCAVFTVSFAVFMIALRPTMVPQTQIASVPIESVPRVGLATEPLHTHAAMASSVEPGEPRTPDEPVPTLQDLAEDNDAETRGEAQALLAMVDAEAMADDR